MATPLHLFTAPRSTIFMSTLGARIVPFAGYEMPVQYPTGIMAEHNWTRSIAGLFDVSHMGQAFVVGPDHATTAAGAGEARAGRCRGPGAWAASAIRSSPIRRAASSTT